MSEAIQNAIEDHASSGLFLVVLLAWLEYVFPPSPGDSTMLFAFFLAGRGSMSLPAVAVAALSGSVLGAMTAYAIGARLGRSYFFLRSGWAREELARIERWYARHGARFLLINRFLPGVRGFFLYAAGITRLQAGAVLIHSTASNILWILLLQLRLAVRLVRPDLQRALQVLVGTLELSFLFVGLRQRVEQGVPGRPGALGEVEVLQRLIHVFLDGVGRPEVEQGHGIIGAQLERLL